MMSLPSGTVTFLLTDVEQSTPLWIQYPAQMRTVLARHDEIARACIAQAGGTLVKPRGEGDSLFTVFADACDAAAAALALQRALCQENWNFPVSLRVRMALHTGEVDMRDGDYYGLTVNLCARIRNVAHGGQILLSQTVADLTRDHLPEGASLLDMGAHGLKDLQRPERLWQMHHPDLPADFPPLRSLAAYKNNLPRQITSFIGRETDVAETRNLLTQTSLLTLLGSGGCGKTRLALQAAADLVDAYPDGVWFVELAPFADPALIAPAIAKTAGVREQAGRDALETLCEALHTQTTLLILDNCEHLAEAAAQAANSLLRACPHLRVLATSRVRLNVPGETAWRVPSLPVPDDKTLTSVEAGMHSPALRLFVERAASAHPRFALTAANLPAVGQICRRLDGIPLAIELAAARVNTLTAQQIAQRLDQSFKLLIGGGPTVLARHQTLQALIDWSHDLLSVQERILLRRLAVFAGGWTLEACEAVCAWGDIETGEALDLLTHLVDASLVIAEEQGEAHRYRLQETMRQYAQERLEEGGEDAPARDRHFHYFLELAEEAEPHLQQAGQKLWLARLETEHDNLRAGMKWAIDNTARLRLACALWRFWSMRSYFEEGRSWLRGTLLRASHAEDHLRAKALNGLGLLATRQSDYTEARAALEESLRLRRIAGDHAGMAETLNNLGNVASAQGRHDEARDLFEQSLQLAESANDARSMAAALNNLGILFVNAGQYEAACEHFQRSLAIYRERNDKAIIASLVGNLGVVCYHLADYTQARQYYEESLALDLEFGDRWGAAMWLHNLSHVAHKQGDFNSAMRFLRDSLNLCLALGDKTGVIRTVDTCAEIAWEMGRSIQSVILSGAVTSLREAISISPNDYEQKQKERILAAARQTLTLEVYEDCWSHGRNMTPEQACMYILTDTSN